jgi:hypothetical protein
MKPKWSLPVSSLVERVRLEKVKNLEEIFLRPSVPLVIIPGPPLPFFL